MQFFFNYRELVFAKFRMRLVPKRQPGIRRAVHSSEKHQSSRNKRSSKLLATAANKSLLFQLTVFNSSNNCLKRDFAFTSSSFVKAQRKSNQLYLTRRRELCDRKKRVGQFERVKEMKKTTIELSLIF